METGSDFFVRSQNGITCCISWSNQISHNLIFYYLLTFKTYAACRAYMLWTAGRKLTQVIITYTVEFKGPVLPFFRAKSPILLSLQSKTVNKSAPFSYVFCGQQPIFFT